MCRSFHDQHCSNFTHVSSLLMLLHLVKHLRMHAKQTKLKDKQFMSLHRFLYFQTHCIIQQSSSSDMVIAPGTFPQIAPRWTLFTFRNPRKVHHSKPVSIKFITHITASTLLASGRRQRIEKIVRHLSRDLLLQVQGQLLHHLLDHRLQLGKYLFGVFIQSLVRRFF